MDAVREIFSFLVKNAANQLLSRLTSTPIRVMDLIPKFLDKLNLVVSATEHRLSLHFRKAPLRFLSMLSTAKEEQAMLIQEGLLEKIF